MDYNLKKSLDTIKAKEFQWYEFNEHDILALGSSKGSSIDFVKGTKFGIKNAEDGKKYLVTQYDVDKFFTLPDSALDVILSKSKKSTYEKSPETETLQFFEYHEITNAEKKAFVKLLSEYSVLHEKQENLMRNDTGRRSRYPSPAEEAKELKLEKDLEKLDEKKSVVNEKFKEKFSDYIPKEKMKSFDLALLVEDQFDVEDADYYLKEFLKKPIVETVSKVKPK
jgi:hypothetical protein